MCTLDIREDDWLDEAQLAAWGIGRLSIGDSLYLSLFTGQRQNDRLLLVDEGLVEGIIFAAFSIALRSVTARLMRLFAPR